MEGRELEELREMVMIFDENNDQQLGWKGVGAARTCQPGSACTGGDYFLLQWPKIHRN